MTAKALALRALDISHRHVTAGENYQASVALLDAVKLIAEFGNDIPDVQPGDARLRQELFQG